MRCWVIPVVRSNAVIDSRGRFVQPSVSHGDHMRVAACVNRSSLWTLPEHRCRCGTVPAAVRGSRPERHEPPVRGPHLPQHRLVVTVTFGAIEHDPHAIGRCEPVRSVTHDSSHHGRRIRCCRHNHHQDRARFGVVLRLCTPVCTY